MKEAILLLSVIIPILMTALGLTLVIVWGRKVLGVPKTVKIPRHGVVFKCKINFQWDYIQVYLNSRYLGERRFYNIRIDNENDVEEYIFTAIDEMYGKHLLIKDSLNKLSVYNHDNEIKKHSEI